MFLYYTGISFDKIIIEWGRHIIISALKESYLEKQVVIPIDKKGLCRIPYSQKWAHGIEEIPSHILVEKIKGENLMGNLTEIFEGNFVFIGAISIGISDHGNTRLKKCPSGCSSCCNAERVFNQYVLFKMVFGTLCDTHNFHRINAGLQLPLKILMASLYDHLFYLCWHRYYYLVSI
jgi:hypothetical protein